MYDISRKSAARLLKLSIRTVDRYVTSKKLSSQERDGRIWLNKKEIQKLKTQKAVDSGQEVSTPKMSTDKRGVNSSENVHMVSTQDNQKSQSAKQNSGNTIYKKLYEEAKEELRVKQERLEGANYRVGQLEAMVKDAVPLLDHRRLLNEEKQLLSQERAVRKEVEEQAESLRQKLENMISHLKEETTNRKIYMVILIIVMILQPVWLWLALGR